MRIALLVLSISLAVGCADTGFSSSDTGGASDGGPCSSGVKQCVGQSYRECKAGALVEIASCSSPQVCVDSLGCADCDPSMGKTCVGNAVHTCGADGKSGALLEQCYSQPCANGACGGGSCGSGTGLIYLVDENYKFLSFDPANGANTFREIGKLSCAASAPWPSWGKTAATPFSMSVDRSGTAWVLYTSGEVFYVDTKTGSCKPSAFVKGQKGYELFGMGFVTDAVKTTTEKLFIFGGKAGDGKMVGGNLAYIDPSTKDITTIGPVSYGEGSPELTGTGNAALYGFFPNGSTSVVRELNKANAAVVKSWPVSGISGQALAWAFAHWGGRFYVFITLYNEYTGETHNQVLRLDPTTGKTDILMKNIPYVVVGAGVSTCAPVIE